MVGEPIAEALLRQDFQENVEIITPQDELVSLKAAAPQAVGDNADLDDEALSALPWEAIYRETDTAGVYVVRRFNNAGEPLDTWMAYNVPPEESRLAIAGDEELRGQLGSDVEVTIQHAESSDWIRSESPGQDVRWWLLAGLLLLLAGEQALAYRLGYHSA